MTTKLIQTKCPAFPIIIFACAVTLLGGCDMKSYDSPAGYSMTKPVKMELGKSLNEISGITFNPTDSSLLAISDSKKKIVEIRLKTKKLKDYTVDVFPGNSDIEDVVKLDSFVYALSSVGMIFRVPLKAIDSAGIERFRLESEGTNDFETLYYDPTVNGLIMLCKSCASDKGKQWRSAYRFDLATKTFDTAAFYTIRTDAVRGVIKDDNAKFEPSAAAINPINHQLYILSSAGQIMIISDGRGKVIEGFHLNPDLFPQAEGIAFTSKGGMYISNEGKYGKASLIFYPYLNTPKSTAK